MDPLYQQVKQYVTDQIAGGHWQAGERLPSENELVRSLGMSRMTVHRALRELSDQGVLQRRAGVGTFVAPARLQRPALPIRDIAEEIHADGLNHACEPLERQTLSLDEAMASIFERRIGGPIFHALVLHRAGSQPVLLEDRWVNPLVAPDYHQVDLAQVTSSHYLLEHAPVQQVEQTVEAIRVDARAAGYLQVEVDCPVLLLRRRTYAHGQVASYAQLYYPGHRYRLNEWADAMPRIGARFKINEPGTR